LAGAASKPPRSLARFAGLVFVPLLVAAPAAAQKDPEPRAYLEVGTELPLKGNATPNGYAFFLWNRPNYLPSRTSTCAW
jgi:hypothetical protein